MYLPPPRAIPNYLAYTATRIDILSSQLAACLLFILLSLLLQCQAGTEFHYNFSGQVFYDPDTLRDKPLVLVAGGMGFSPLYSILLVALQENKKRPVSLLYSGKHPDDILFLVSLPWNLWQGLCILVLPIIYQLGLNLTMCNWRKLSGSIP